MKTTRIKISGLVQEVFFRKYMKVEADKLKLKGHVRNLDDGRVEVIVEGRDEDVDTMKLVCKKGSPHSEVKKIEIQELNHIGFDDFRILNI